MNHYSIADTVVVVGIFEPAKTTGRRLAGARVSSSRARHFRRFPPSASPLRSRVSGHVLNPVVGQEGLGGVEAGEVWRLEEHLRQGVHPLRRHEQRPVARCLRRATHGRHELPVREEEPAHGRLHRLESLQQLDLACVLAFAAPTAVVQPHGSLLHPRPAVGVDLHADHPGHPLLDVPRGVRDVQQRPGPEAEGRVGAGPYREQALEPQEVVRVHEQVQVLDVGLNVGLACTSAVVGAAVLNYAEVVSLIKDESGERVIGARIRDTLSGKEFDTFAKVVVNASGAFCDSVRKMADNNVVPMICPSSGVHIVLPDYYSPEGMGLIVPKTKDGRVVFMLPWLGRTVAGTTDSSTDITMLPEPHEDEIQFILDAICDYLNVQVRRSDVLSAWSGIRPLAMDPSAKNTESISRDHVVFEDYPGLITITGGKWTTYRSMAEDAVNAAIRSGNLTPANGCVTDHLHIVGGYGWDPASFTVLAQNYKRMKKTYGGKVIPGAMDSAVSKHLSRAYGTLAERVAAIAQNKGLGKRLAHGYPFLEAEVAYCARHEYCESAVDFVARRCRLAFLDTDAAGRALPRIIEILACEHKWDKARRKLELQKGTEFLETFKSSKNAQFRDGKHNGQ